MLCVADIVAVEVIVYLLDTTSAAKGVDRGFK